MATVLSENAAAPAVKSMRARAADAVRTIAHTSHEARMLKSMACDAVEDAAYRARRTAKMARRELNDAGFDAAYRIRQQPLKAVGVAFGAGVLVGAASGLVAWLASRGRCNGET